MAVQWVWLLQAVLVALPWATCAQEKLRTLTPGDDGVTLNVQGHGRGYRNHNFDSPSPCPSTYDFETLSESPEHQYIGDLLRLKFNGEERKGSNWNYIINGQPITFGQVVTLGDFYANRAKGLQVCSQQISDGNTTEATQIFQNIVNLILAEDNSKMLKDIVTILQNQFTDTRYAPDPGQEFNRSNAGWIAGYDSQYTLCTNGWYLNVAMCNWDHFGKDAIQAYTIGHSVAMAKASSAADNFELLEAYFYEAFAQHYLTDLFSMGHNRVPRRALHSSFQLNPKDPNPLNGFPADRCNQFMHDEDSANGLWVRNLRGEAWPAYGDKQLFASKSYINLDRTIAAMQAGVDEVFEVFQSKKAKSPSEYDALSMIPIPDDSGNTVNFVPLFKVDSNSETLSMRSNIESRGNLDTTLYNLDKLRKKPSGWRPIAEKIKSSGPIVNLYPRTIQQLTSEANITHVRHLNASHLVVNKYGPVWTALHEIWPGQTAQRSWNMISQGLVPVGNVPVSTSWEWAQEVTPSIYSLIGTIEDSLVFLGLSDSPKEIILQWKSTVQLSTTCNTPKHVYGNFNTKTSQAALVRYCAGQQAQLQIWIQQNFSSAPYLSDSWPLTTSPKTLTSLFAMNISGEKQQTFVKVAYEDSSFSFIWSFTKWSDAEYKEKHSMTYNETRSGTGGAYTFLLGRPDKGFQKIIARIITASSIPSVQVDILQIQNNQISLLRTVNLGWVETCEDITWLFVDINSDGGDDLIAYCRTSTTLIVVHFLSCNDGTFTFEPYEAAKFGSDHLPNFNGPYLKHILISPTAYFDSGSQKTLPSKGLLELFDNYGVIGARMFTPTFEGLGPFNVVGQVPSIAGQVAKALGGDNTSDEVGFIFS